MTAAVGAMRSARRLAVGVRAHLVSVLREPTTLALLFVLPPLVVVGYAEAMSAFPDLPMLSAVPETAGRIGGALFATAFLAGLLGLFQVVSASEVDRRLVRAGFGRGSLFAGRLVAVGIVGTVAAALSLGTLWVGVEPEAPALAFAALLLAGLTYGLVGMLVGAVVTRELEGSLLLVFLADMDSFLASGLLDVGTGIRTLFPLSAPHALFEAAVLDGTVAIDHLAPGATTVLVLFVLAAGAYAHRTGGAH